MSFLSNLNALLKFTASFFKGVAIGTFYMLKALLLFFVPKCFRFKDISKDIVLITGGASGLGRLMAKKFAKLGATVVIWDLNPNGLEETAKMVEELRSKKDKVGRCYHYQVDIGDRFKVYAAAERVRREVGEVSMLINNAGIVTGKRFLECTDEQVLKTFDVNVLAHFWLIKAFLPSMMERNHGHIVSVASIAGLLGAYQLTDYCASKFAAVGLEDALRLELNCDGYHGIHSTIVCPYYINTGMFSGIGRSLIPIMTPEFVVNETVKAILVNQEVLYLPAIVYFLYASRSVLPTKTFLWFHRAIGAAATMKTFKGRNSQQQQQQQTQQQQQPPQTLTQEVTIRMKPETVGITMPAEPNELTRIDVNGLNQ